MKPPANWCRFSFKPILFASFMTAVFYAGYHLGYRVGWDANNWDEVGGSGSISAHPLTIDGCVVLSDQPSQVKPVTLSRWIIPAVMLSMIHLIRRT